MVARTLTDPSPQHARDFTARVTEMDLVLVDTEMNDAEGELGLSTAFAVVARWLAGVREECADEPVAEEALGWVRSNLGPVCTTLSGRAAGILGPRANLERTAQESVDELSDDFLPALIWLTAGAVARYGGEDMAWLRRHDGANKGATGA